MESLNLAQQIAEEVQDTKGKEIEILDLKKLVSFTDYFILVSGTSDRHVQAIADRVNLRLKKDLGRLPMNFEGYASAQWVLLDYGDVVLHVFRPEQREYYGLDDFWVQAPRIRLPKAAKKINSEKSAEQI